MSVTSKRARTSLSVHEKTIVKSYCEQRSEECKKRSESAPSQDTLRQEILAKFGWEVGRSTLSKIMTMDWKLLQSKTHLNPNMKRKRKPLFPEFEERLVKYIHVYQMQCALDDSLPVVGVTGQELMGLSTVNEDYNQMVPKSTITSAFLTEAVILEEAQRLKQELGIKDEDLVLSVGWLARFKYRNNIRLRKAGANKYPQSKSTRVIERSKQSPSLPGEVDALPYDEFQSITPEVKRRKRFDRASAASESSTDFEGYYHTIRHHFDLTATVTEDSRKFPFPNPCLAHSSDSELMQIPEEIKAIQCDSDTLLPAGIQGLSVLVCGIGSCYEGYMATHRVGRDGFLTCVDMQPENISIAETHIDAYTRTLGLDKSNCCFVHGYLEDISLQIRPHTIDLIVFNCSFDYVPNKELIFQAAQNLLRPGGELILSHFYSSRRLSSSIKEILANSLPSSDIKLLHATYEQDFRRLYEKEQFKVVRKLGIHKIQLNETTAERLSQVIEGTTQFHRAVFRCFKFSSEVEDCEEDYHQIGYYRGGIAGSESSYQLDDENLFVKDVGLVVSGNTARILLETWLNKYFEVQGDQSVHYGVWSSNTSE